MAVATAAAAAMPRAIPADASAWASGDGALFSVGRRVVDTVGMLELLMLSAPLAPMMPPVARAGVPKGKPPTVVNCTAARTYGDE